MDHFYQRWTHGHIRSEPEDLKLDCSNCHMVSENWSRGLTRDLGPFLPSLKCCSFDPFLPGFTLGSPEFRKTVSPVDLKDYLSRRKLTPLGALPRAGDNQAIQKSIQRNSICEAGRDAKNACAFLSKDGRAKCTIHEFRPSSCRAYVCRSKQGVDGFRNWRDWENEINRFAWTLSHLAAFELGYTMDDVTDELAADKLALDFALEFYSRVHQVAIGISPWVD